LLLTIFDAASFHRFTSSTVAAFLNDRIRAIQFHFASLKIADFRKNPHGAHNGHPELGKADVQFPTRDNNMTFDAARLFGTSYCSCAAKAVSQFYSARDSV
jgi:hypothetical protein